MLMRLHDLDRMFNAMDLLQRKLTGDQAGITRGRPLFADWNVPQHGPGANLYDKGENLEMTLEVPGMGKDDLGIKIQGNYLEVSGKRESDAPEGYSAHRVERGTSSFTRSFTLPAEVDSSKVEARLNNGLLVLVLPKAEAAKPKQITIQ
ncbi:MAG: Hsp20/alpha crystallin family protein [Desulfobulbus sp.]|nr:MAG: Hsp20/alpha crystallin family protein [Desulfobulbus sp.]RUM41608.1 MAG: Hsp20/alpha crystallin family protein [Desulfobulbus sp.]